MKPVLELVKQAEFAALIAFEVRLPAFDHPYHYHPQLELTAITESSGQRLVGDHLADFEPGDLVLHGSGLPHYYYHPFPLNAGEEARALVVQWPADVLAPLFLEAPELREVQRLFDRAACGLQVTGEDREPVIALMREMTETTGAGRWAAFWRILQKLTRPAIQERLVELASPEYSAGGDTRSRGGATPDQRIERVQKWLRENFRNNVRQSDAAKIAGMTSQAFCRFFRKHTGRTFNRFLNEMRIGYCCRRLIQTDLTTAEIAYDAGYRNLANFNRRFRELRQCSPTEFRKGLPAAG